MAVVDSYTSTPNTTFTLWFGAVGLGQSFAGDGSTLDDIVFKLRKAGSPATTLTANIYAVSGTHGTNAVPTGAALATSGTVNASSLSTTSTDTTFTFSGANQITLTNGTIYVVTVEVSATGDFSNNVVASQISGGSHAGNASTKSASWAAATSGLDCYFIVHGTSATARRILIV